MKKTRDNTNRVLGSSILGDRHKIVVSPPYPKGPGAGDVRHNKRVVFVLLSDHRKGGLTMRRITFLAVILCFAVVALAAVLGPRVDESAMRAVYSAEGVSVTLPIASAGASLAHIKLELLETE